MNRHYTLSSQATRTVRMPVQLLGSILNLEEVEPEPCQAVTPPYHPGFDIAISHWYSDIFSSVKNNDGLNFEQVLGRVCSCHALLHTTSLWRHSTCNRRSRSSWLSRNIEPNNGIHHISREHRSLHARPHRLLHHPQIRHPARRHRIRRLQELSNMDTATRILLPDRSYRNTLLSDQRNCSALLHSAAMGLSANLSPDRTNPNHQSRRQHGPRPRRPRLDETQPKLSKLVPSH